MSYRKKQRDRLKMPFSWRAWQIACCGVFGAGLFFLLYFNIVDGLYTSVGSTPDNTEKLVFGICFAFFFMCMAAIFSNIIMWRILRKESMSDIAEAIGKEVAAEALSVIIDGAGTAASGGSGRGSSGTKGGGGSSGGGGASGEY